MVVLGLSECLSQILDFGDRNDRSQSTLAILLTLVLTPFHPGITNTNTIE